jgi:hypothetical protein
MKAAAAPGQGKPTGLIGLSGAGRLFTEGVLRLMGELNEQPIIMPMSNPTHRMECTAEDAQRMTGAARQPRGVTSPAAEVCGCSTLLALLSRAARNSRGCHHLCSTSKHGRPVWPYGRCS